MTLAEEDAAEDKLIKSLVGEAVKTVFNRYADFDEYESISEQFKGNLTFPAGDDLPADEVVANMKTIKGLPQAAQGLAKELQLDGGDDATACGRRRVSAGRALRQQPPEQVQREGQDVLQKVVTERAAYPT